ncbi:MAG: hypothetical protein ACR2K2_07025 [Mycobacteriales bacterium]
MVQPIPPGLLPLVAHYREKPQRAVRFRAPSWEKALAKAPTEATALLREALYTKPYGGDKASSADRTVDRAQLASACKAMVLDDRDSVLSTFVLVMAWGYGPNGSRGNVARALVDPESAHAALSSSATILRRAESAADGAVDQAHKEFRVPGVRQAFFTKWFAFAGHSPGRDWQPLILDSHVYLTLHQTLRVTTTDLADSRRRARRYVAYVEALHSWAHELRVAEGNVDAQQLEWVLFQHNGAALPAGC